ncbi:SEC14L2 [Cordylochernes scorpioides]|uniref:SEC14L2 n=1 Tax=Cordylochernes scorpioides TaxID=51811 RepID=A0ABY6K416_9ARAC|nr:SEC14L2 [Cordylochernes scorpioides]
MPRRKIRAHYEHMPEFETGRAIGLKEAGWSNRPIARHLCRSDVAIRRCWQKWVNNGRIQRQDGSGRPRATTEREDRTIVRMAVAAPESTLTTIQRVTGTQVSQMTFNRQLRERNLRARRPLRCLPLTPVHRKVRLQWCRERSTWKCADWGRIVFSDESRFLLCPDDRRKRVWRRPGLRVDPGLTVEHHTGPQQGVMVWGAISFDSRTPLLVILAPWQHNVGLHVGEGIRDVFVFDLRHPLLVLSHPVDFNGFCSKPVVECAGQSCHRNGGSMNLHQVLCEKRIQGCRNFWMLQTAYVDAVISRKRVLEWYQRFKEGREETADNEHLTFDQKNALKKTASLNLEATTDDPELLKRVITGDETWIYGFHSETTQQASEWRFKNEPRPKKARMAPSQVKVMLMVFFDYQGIVHHEFQQQDSTITSDSYLGVLRRLREAIKQKRPELWRSKSWILHHDNAPAHTTLTISKFLQDHSTSVFPQPPYSPDLAPCDFFLFENLKKKVKGSEISEHRRDQSGIEESHEGDPENRQQEMFCRLEKRWLKCIAANGDYFEGNNLNLLPQDYEGIVQVLYRLEEKQFNVENIEAHLINESGRVQQKKKDDGLDIVANAYQTKAPRMYQGNKKKNYFSAKAQYSSGSMLEPTVHPRTARTHDIRNCSFCGKTGHLLKDCFLRNKNSQWQHYRKDQNYKGKSSAFHSETISFHHICERASDPTSELGEWLIDSAATSHFYKEKDWFVNYQDIPPMDALIGDVDCKSTILDNITSQRERERRYIIQFYKVMEDEGRRKPRRWRVLDQAMSGSSISEPNLDKVAIYSQLYRRQDGKGVVLKAGTAEEPGLQLDKVVDTHSIIFDMDGFTMKQLAWKPAVDMIRHLVAVMENNYPERLKKIYVINAPKFFPMAYSLVKPFLSETTAAKIHVYVKERNVRTNVVDTWKTPLLEDIDPNELPAHWGGTMTGLDGNPRCPDLVGAGGQVPGSYYTAPSRRLSTDKNLTAAVVEKKGTLPVEMSVTEPGSSLHWEFQTEDYDIGFGVDRRLEDGSVETLVPMQRVNCHLVPEDGIVVCDKPGQCTWPPSDRSKYQLDISDVSLVIIIRELLRDCIYYYP